MPHKSINTTQPAAEFHQPLSTGTDLSLKTVVIIDTSLAILTCTPTPEYPSQFATNKKFLALLENSLQTFPNPCFTRMALLNFDYTAPRNAAEEANHTLFYTGCKRGHERKTLSSLQGMLICSMQRNFPTLHSHFDSHVFSATVLDHTLQDKLESAVASFEWDNNYQLEGNRALSYSTIDAEARLTNFADLIQQIRTHYGTSARIIFISDNDALARAIQATNPSAVTLLQTPHIGDLQYNEHELSRILEALQQTQSHQPTEKLQLACVLDIDDSICLLPLSALLERLFTKVSVNIHHTCAINPELIAVLRILQQHFNLLLNFLTARMYTPEHLRAQHSAYNFTVDVITQVLQSLGFYISPDNPYSYMAWHPARPNKYYYGTDKITHIKMHCTLSQNREAAQASIAATYDKLATQDPAHYSVTNLLANIAKLENLKPQIDQITTAIKQDELRLKSADLVNYQYQLDQIHQYLQNYFKLIEESTHISREEKLKLEISTALELWSYCDEQLQGIMPPYIPTGVPILFIDDSDEHTKATPARQELLQSLHHHTGGRHAVGIFQVAGNGNLSAAQLTLLQTQLQGCAIADGVISASVLTPEKLTAQLQAANLIPVSSAEAEIAGYGTSTQTTPANSTDLCSSTTFTPISSSSLQTEQSQADTPLLSTEKTAPIVESVFRHNTASAFTPTLFGEKFFRHQHEAAHTAESTPTNKTSG